jgi:hypothetical protein
MERPFKVYTITLGKNAAPLGAYTANWYLNLYRREFKIRSVLFQILMETGNGTIIPVENNTSQTYSLLLAQEPSGVLMSSYPHENITDASGLFKTTGTGIMLIKAGQYHFDSFYLRERLYYKFDYLNRDVLNNITFTASIVTEIEEL